MTDPIDHTPARVEVETLTDPHRCRVIITDPDGSKRWAWLDPEQAQRDGSVLLLWARRARRSGS